MPPNGKLIGAFRQVTLAEIKQRVTAGPVELDTAWVTAGRALWPNALMGRRFQLRAEGIA